MKSKRKHKKLKFRIWLSFVLFTVFCITFIWLLQTILFESNYRLEMGNSMYSNGEGIYAEITENGKLPESPVIPESLVIALNETGVEVAIVKKTNEDISYVYPIRSPLTESDFYYGVYDVIISKVDISKSTKAISSVSDDDNIMYYARKLVSDFDDDSYLILTCATNTLGDVVETLRDQLFVTAAISIIVALIISFMIADKLSAPIDKMSEVAKSWARGDENVHFEGADYQEIDELATALNFAKDEKSKAEILQRDLLANITHDLKTPLTMIKAYAEKIRDISGENKEKRDKDTTVIIEEADRLTLLVNDILNLSKLQSYVDAPDMSVFNLSELLENVTYRFAQAMSEKGYILKCEIEQGVYVFADEKKIEEVLYNLIGNSINYTGEDKTVKIYFTTGGKYATLEILDSGKGIEKDKIDGIWEKYLRYSETHHRAVKGTGLGLSIVKTILDAHNVKYGVISKKDVGSNFFVRFEIAERGDEVVDEGGAENG